MGVCSVHECGEVFLHHHKDGIYCQILVGEGFGVLVVVQHFGLCGPVGGAVGAVVEVFVVIYILLVSPHKVKGIFGHLVCLAGCFAGQGHEVNADVARMGSLGSDAGDADKGEQECVNEFHRYTW